MSGAATTSSHSKTGHHDQNKLPQGERSDVSWFRLNRISGRVTRCGRYPALNRAGDLPPLCVPENSSHQEPR
jgi:hypothetical protein